MVYGPDPEVNLERLRGVVEQVEIVLFWTPEQHNIPSHPAVERMADRMERFGLGCTVHLPSDLQIAAEDPGMRRRSVDRVERIVRRMAPLGPRHYVLHVPFTVPTLAPVPGMYFAAGEAERFSEWADRARRSLAALNRGVGRRDRLLVENINFSPSYLLPFCREGLCGLCLDIGHLLLGGETVGAVLDDCLPLVEEIHLHGVRGWDEHIGLDVVAAGRLRRWLKRLRGGNFRGIVNLEVFSDRDLRASLAALGRAWVDRP